MSGKVVTWAMDQRTGSPAAKLVLVKLADNANDQGFCWPSIDTIIEHTELGQSTVYKHLAALEGMGLVKMLDAPHPEHGITIKAFQIAVPWLNDGIPPRGKGRRAIPPGGKSSPPGGNEIPGGGNQIPPGGIHIEEPSNEPSIEPSGNHKTAAPVAGASPPSDLFGSPEKPATKTDTIAQAFDLYDEAAARLGWGACQARTESRAKKLWRRLEDAGGIAGWQAALEKAEASDFLMGQTRPREDRPPFKLDIDFLLQQSSFVKLMEGKYDNRSPGGPAAGGGFLAAAARVAERYATDGS